MLSTKGYWFFLGFLHLELSTSAYSLKGLAHRLDIGNELVHLPSRDALFVHLVNLSGVAPRTFWQEEVEQDADHDGCTEKQPGRFISPVRAIGVHYGGQNGSALKSTA